MSDQDAAAGSQPLDEIAYCKIHPGLGIARLGDSPEEFFIGPESPGHMAHPIGGFKDSEGRIKRQAARFRVYGYNAAGVPVAELTAANADIEWTVQLANKKASYEMFLGRYWDMQYPALDHKHPLRNQEVTDPEERKRVLEIRPEARSINGRNEGGKQYQMSGTFGPLRYTIVNADTRAALQGSRSGFLNVPFVDPSAPDITKQLADTAAKYNWQAGVMLEPTAESPVADVYLGEVRTDAHGRLLVLGGRGMSRSVIPENEIGFLNIDAYYANNDYWHDDTSDGPVSAKVTVNGRTVEVRGKSWVLVVPPKFAPHAETLTTLYDVALEAAAEKTPGTPKVPDQVSFTREVYPILARLSQYQWLNQFALAQHGTGKVFDPMQYDPTSPESIAQSLFTLLHVKDNPAAGPMRNHLFSRVRVPLPILQEQYPGIPLEELLMSKEATDFATAAFMPQMYGDGGQWSTLQLSSAATPGGIYTLWATLSARQYRVLQKWVNDQYVDDWPANTPPSRPPRGGHINALPVAEQPAALDRASLEPCVGAPFYPGIEITYISQDPNLWSELGRLDADQLEPGDITRHMALPWQADFAECNHRWWPAARPDEIVTTEQYDFVVKYYDQALDGPLAAQLDSRVEWSRPLPANSPFIDRAMVHAWKELGFVVPREGPDEQIVYVETDRDPYAGATLRDAFYYLMNIDANEGFLPQARKRVERYLAQAKLNQRDPELGGGQGGSIFSYFPYSKVAFDARLNAVYDSYVTSNSAPATYLASTTRDERIYQILQNAPFNQLDGTWIRGAAPPGTVDEVRSLLFQIYMDEMGDAVDSQNHSNVYTDLLKSLNIYLPDIRSREYAYDSRFLDSAFTQPVFLLAISTFTEQYLPEILGMTLYLEWGSIGLIGIVDELESFGIDPLYYKLHVGIDNAAAGHGALAKKAVELYLDQMLQQGGDELVQQMWARIWNGYVAFATLGSLQQDIADHFAQPPNLVDQMVAMINSKAEYASKNHRNKTLGGSPINDWFDDPAGMLGALQSAGYIVPGKPEISPIFDLMSFTGPMYHVFTAEEQELWTAYVLSLAPPPKQPQYDVEQAMRYIIDKLRQRQVDQPGHQVRLTGPDAKGVPVTKPIQAWFTDGDSAVMRALRNPINGWIVPGDSTNSPFLTRMLAGNGDMAVAFRETVPNTDGKSYKQIFAEWVDGGCIVEGRVEEGYAAARQKRVAAAGRLTISGGTPKRAPEISEAPEEPPVKRRRRLYGMGAVH